MTVARMLLGGALAAAVAVPALAQDPPPYQLPPPPAAEPTPEPAPERLHTVLLTRLSGRVMYRALGRRGFRRLREPVAVRLGSEVDTRRGHVRLTAQRAERFRERSEFWGGRFRITQREDATTVSLRGGNFAETCEEDAATARASAARPRRVRRLWGKGRGRFRTRGRFSAATVRGTQWLVEDRCDGTLTRVATGEVEVEDFTVPEQQPPARPAPVTGGGGQGVAPAPTAPPRPRRVRIRRGDSYVAAR